MLHLAGSAVPESPLAAYKNRIAEANCRIERRVRPQEYVDTRLKVWSQAHVGMPSLDRAFAE